jgi:hypothetical protein
MIGDDGAERAIDGTFRVQKVPTTGTNGWDKSMMTAIDRQTRYSFDR